MKSVIREINPAFEHSARLGIMSALMVNETISFVELRDLLDITDGKLSVNIAYLEEMGFLKVAKRIVDKRSRTTFRITSAGRTAFLEHLAALEMLIKEIQK